VLAAALGPADRTAVKELAVCVYTLSAKHNSLIKVRTKQEWDFDKSTSCGSSDG